MLVVGANCLIGFVTYEYLTVLAPNYLVPFLGKAGAARPCRGGSCQHKWFQLGGSGRHFFTPCFRNFANSKNAWLASLS